MSCVCILTPVVIAAWPAFSAAVVAAAHSLGYALAEEAVHQRKKMAVENASREVSLEIANSEVVTDHLARQQQICVVRDKVTVRFSRDARGTASVCVSGAGYTDDELRARQFVVVEEQVDESQAIRLKVRHWDG